MDTISFRIVAPDGFYIKSVTYRQRGSGSNLRTGRAGGGSNWVIGDHAADLGTFGTVPDVAQTADLSGLRLTFVPVSITTALFSFSTPQAGAASIAITGADVLVELADLSQPTVEGPPVGEVPALSADEPAPSADEPLAPTP